MNTEKKRDYPLAVSKHTCQLSLLCTLFSKLSELNGLVAKRTLLESVSGSFMEA